MMVGGTVRDEREVECAQEVGDGDGGVGICGGEGRDIDSNHLC